MSRVLGVGGVHSRHRRPVTIPDPLGINGLVTALGGNSAVLAFYDGRTGITLDGGGKLSTQDDARGPSGYGPQRVGAGSPKPSVVSNEIITDGSQNYLATAVSSVFDINVAKTIVWISTVPSSGANFPWVIQDFPLTKWQSIRGTDATVYWSLTASHSRIALSNTRRMHIINHWGPSPSGGSWVGDNPKWFRGHSRIPESIDFSSANNDTGYLQSIGSAVGAGLFSVAKERAMIVVDHLLDATEYDALAAWAVTHHSVVEDAGPPVIICNGNSLTYGQGASDRTTTSYPALIAANFSSYDVLNAGAVGYRGTEMLAVQPKLILPLYDASRGVSAYVYWEGHNDLLFFSAAQVETNTHDACLAAKNRGFKVVVLTSPVSATITGAGAESKRVAYNTWIRANWSGFADGLADVAQIPELSDYTNTTYFNGDQTHLTDAGYDKVANDATYGVTAALTALGL